MKIAEMFSVASSSAAGFVWKWRSKDGKAESSHCFDFYHDGMVDAQKLGYEVEQTRAEGNRAPGGARQNLA